MKSITLILLLTCLQFANVARAQSIDEILEKYYAALGGKDQVLAVKSAGKKTTGFWINEKLDSSVSEQKMLFPYYETSRTVFPDKVSLSVNNDNGHYLTLEGKMTWRSDSKQECDIHPALQLHLLLQGGKLSVTRDSVIAGEDCRALAAAGKGIYNDVYYFSKTTGLLVAVAQPVFHRLTVYTQYDTVQGILYPMMSEFFSPQNEGRKWTTVDYIEFNVPMAVGDFDFDEDTKLCRRKINSPFNRIEYITDGVENLTLVEVLQKHFAGKKVLIDLWATWCIPCHIDFQSFNDSFYEFLYNQEVSIVFISVDKVSHKSMWTKDIDKLNLNGYHLMAPPASPLYSDIVKSIYPNGQFFVPRYILVNEKGDIVSTDVRKPRDFQFQANILSLLEGGK